MLLKTAYEAGKISDRNSKMPGSTFALNTSNCPTGSKLAAVPGSVCHGCYASKLERLRPSVLSGWTNNYFKATAMISSHPDKWADAMAFQIAKSAERSGEPFHRWFDSGDLQSVDMLRAIVLVCERLPSISHWLPTREAAIVKAYRAKHGAFPSNLVVRISSTMVDDAPIAGHELTSTVHKAAAPVGHVCPARHQGNACGDCRACWTHGVANVSYPFH